MSRVKYFTDEEAAAMRDAYRAGMSVSGIMRGLRRGFTCGPLTMLLRGITYKSAPRPVLEAEWRTYGRRK